MALAGAVGTAAYGLMLKHYTNAYAPVIDSAVLMFSVIAQVLLMGRRIENWPVWLLVNTVSVPLYASRGLYLTAALYAAYWINALVACLFPCKVLTRIACLDKVVYFGGFTVANCRQGCLYIQKAYRSEF